MKYNHLDIESKWQKYWDENQTFNTKIDKNKKKVYVLDMFPYPSGTGLHVGHPLGYTATDIYSRFKRLQGFNVLHPMGWDAFGLPAEQYAIKTGTHPKQTTEQNIKNFKRQIKMLGFSYDWSREVNTTDESYYRWTQWIFLQIYKKGLAYEAKVPVNWCPELKTVLANEEVVDGKSEIGGHPVIRKPMRQWMLKITEYAESLLNGLDNLDWPESVKDLQRNWIGKSEGANIRFQLDGFDETITIYTTRPDTLFGATYLVLAPEHSLVSKIVTPNQQSAINKYCEKSLKKSDLDRGELNKEKTGVNTGSYAINPVNNKKIPIWVADYVLITYGTGSIMAVPGQDQRDWEFAKKFKLPIIRTVHTPKDFDNKSAYTGDGPAINSDFLNGMMIDEAKNKIIHWLEENKVGERSIEYKLRDWLFSRQRYWGEPIPIIHGTNGDVIPLNDNDLPLTLPNIKKYEPTDTGESPLGNIKDWTDQTNGRRETNTMPQWAGSCWYYLRYIDPKNNELPWSKEAENYWMPVDLYVGGTEHAVLHLLYARFWHHVLYDLGLVSTKEPFQKLFNQGMIQGEDGQKMSKSRGNVVNPDDVVNDYGADSFRLYEMFMGPLEKSKPWSTTGLQGCFRFIQKIWRLFYENPEKIIEGAENQETKKLLNQTIKKITDDLENLRFNTSVSQLMILVNHFTSLEYLDKETLRTFLILLNPFAPHISEELNQKLGYDPLHLCDWPSYDKSLIENDDIQIVVQLNGKKRGDIIAKKDSSQSEIQNIIDNDEKLQKYFVDVNIIKVIYVKGRIINFVVKK